MSKKSKQLWGKNVSELKFINPLVLTNLMDLRLPEVIADRIWKGLERKKTYGFLHKPYLNMVALPDFGKQSIMSEGLQ